MTRSLLLFRLLLLVAGTALTGGRATAEQTLPGAQSPEQNIDALIEQRLLELGVEPNEPIDDATFLRRIYLDLAGRIPTIEEAERFYDQGAEIRRSRTIDGLLASDGYVSHFYHFWADLLRINGRLGLNETPDAVEYAYRLWVKKALHDNLPYDEFVRQLVTAEGHFWDNGAVGYYQRDRGMPLDNMSNTVRLFLGTRLECAQCHDHPFDHWTQMDYYKMAAFSYGMTSQGHSHANRDALRAHFEREGGEIYRRTTGLEGLPEFSKSQELSRWIDELKKRDQWTDQLRRWSLTEGELIAAANRGMDALSEQQRTAQRVTKAEDSLHVRVRYVTTAEKPRALQLPHDYQYSDAAAFDTVAAHSMFGDNVESSGTENGAIGDYAEWLTSKRNPTFTRVIANRLWKKVFGAGLFEPLDEITDNTPIHDPKLMAYLEQQMRDLDYDMKAYLAILCRTRAYQRAATVQIPPAGEAYSFAGPVFRRMSAEQIWDSVIGLVLPDSDRYRPTLKTQLRAIHQRERIYGALADMPTEQYIAALVELEEASTKDAAELATIREQLPVAVAGKDHERVRQLQETQKQLVGGLGTRITRIQTSPQPPLDDTELLARFFTVEVEPDGDVSQEGELWPVVTAGFKPAFPRAPVGLDAGQAKEWRQQAQTDYRAFLSLSAQWARAAELSSPAPRGHFLRDFGQSDREMIDNAACNASVPQALNLLNGPLAEAINNRFSVVGSQLQLAGSAEDKAALLFEAMLTRKAGETERRWMLEEIDRCGEAQALQNIAWALLNTRRFLFIR